MTEVFLCSEVRKEGIAEAAYAAADGIEKHPPGLCRPSGKQLYRRAQICGEFRFQIFQERTGISMQKELAKNYNPKDIEDRLYEKWESRKYFHAEPDETKEPFTIVIPPPNITGQLHMGHALDNTMQDILVRFKRMQGYNTLWQPGTDHASIATEVKIIEHLKKEGIDKKELGREGFLKRAWAWKEEYGGRIVQQLKKMGSSCDWDRERFTMDEGCSKAVEEVFCKMHEKGTGYLMCQKWPACSS